MKKTTHKKAKKTVAGPITRREFVGGALAAGVVAGAPAFLRGRNLNDKLDIAFIACGGRANASLNELTITPGRGGSGAAAASGASASTPVAPHPDENVVVLCDVNQLAVDEASKRFPKAKTFNDLRRVFDNPNAFDAVVVSTAEHTHAFATYLALTHGKHVYLREAPDLQHLGSQAHSGDRREIPEAVDADGQPGPRLGRAADDQGNPHDRRHRPGARGSRVGGTCLGPPGCGVR